MVTVGSRLPEFRAPASTGQTLASDSFRGTVPLVVMTVPDLDSDATRRQLAAANERLADFSARRVQLLAIARATAAEVRDRAERDAINFPILSDPASEFLRAAGMADDDGTPTRVSLIVNALGTVIDVLEPGDDPADHAGDLIARVEEHGDTLGIDPLGLTEA